MIDDEANTRVALDELLVDEGFDVETASDGVDGLAKIDTFQPHFVLTDLRMPRMDGRELLSHILARTPHPAVFIMTGDTPSYASRWARDAVQYVSKPIDLGDLVRRFDALLQRPELGAALG
ncbi:MAG TPA: response regulator [Polyangiaceae bacterium]|nr:response regulator [Polyangiaceae bacterium]